MKIFKLIFTASFLFLIFQKINGQSDPKAVELINKLENKVGTWNALWSKKDVTYNYNYENVASGKKDYSIEKYIFEGEHSWAQYKIHQINVFPNSKEIVTQSLVKNNTTATIGNTAITDSKLLDVTNFLRKANYYWFTIFFKLNESGVIKKYQGTTIVNDVKYDKVLVTYDSKTLNKEENDTYIFYINPNTNLVDQFYFSLPYRGIKKPILLMKLEYENSNGFYLHTKRSIYKPKKNGTYSDVPYTVQTLSNIKFNTGLTPNGLKL